jgi:hypothetical protein
MMWASFRNLFSRSKNLQAPLGDVVFESKAVCGQAASSQFQWQVKRGVDDKSYFVCIKMRADDSAGREDAPTNYIDFDLPTALKVRADIDECIAIARHFASPDGATS